MDNQAEQSVLKLIEEENFDRKPAKGFNKLIGKFGDIYRCDETEHIDKVDFPIEKKIKILKGLDLKNNIFGTYKSIFNYLKPLIVEVNEKENRAFRILELAGGLGDLSIGIYKEFIDSNSNLKIDITGSDIVPAYIDISAEKASKKNYPINFKVIDIYKIEESDEESYDIVITLHSIHHFKPLPLFHLIRKSQLIAKQGLFAIDGTRNIPNLLFMYSSALIPTIVELNGMYAHDALISARRMYSRDFLKKLAFLAEPTAEIDCGKLSLGLNYLRVKPRQ